MVLLLPAREWVCIDILITLVGRVGDDSLGPHTLLVSCGTCLLVSKRLLLQRLSLPFLWAASCPLWAHGSYLLRSSMPFLHPILLIFVGSLYLHPFLLVGNNAQSVRCIWLSLVKMVGVRLWDSWTVWRTLPSILVLLGQASILW